MKLSRVTQLLQGLSSQERKVYTATPIGAPWSAAQLVGELQRLGSQMAHREVLGAMHRLLAAGLVNEPTQGQFIRAAIKAVPAPQAEEEAMTLAAPFNSPSLDSLRSDRRIYGKEAKEEPKDVATLLGLLAGKHRKLADEHRALADEFEAVAIAALERDEEVNTQLAKFNQLRELLKGGL